MYILSNAMKNLVRNRGRNILIAAVMFISVLSAVVAMTINNAASRVIEDAYLDIGSKVDIAVDMAKYYGTGQRAEPLTFEQYQAFADSEYLAGVVYIAEVLSYSYSVTGIGDEDRSAGTTQLNDGTIINIPTMKLVGNSNTENLSDFGDKREIIDGRIYEAKNECVISEALAELNGLAVGDVIEVETSFPPIAKYELTVTGIYSDTTDEYPIAHQMAYFNRRNEILCGFDTAISNPDMDFAYVDMKSEYYLKHPDMLGDFEAEVRAKGLPDMYDVSINDAAYEKMVGPMNGLKSISITFMIVILILGAIILFLISAMAIRERKYEIGVLRAMGMEKGKISIGLVTEAIVITALCLVIGLSLGSLIAQPVANGILDGQVASAEANDQGGANRVLIANGKSQVGDGTEGVTPISEIQVALSSDTIIQIILLAVALAILSSMVGIVQMTKYEPMKLLSERN